jgi:pentapeptide repeat protein
MYWALGGLGALILFAIIGYLSLKLAPDWFESDQFPDTPCRPDDNEYKACLEIATARADERRGITTATLALFVGALSAVGAVYTALTFSENRKVSRREHTLNVEAHERSSTAADNRQKLDLEASARERDRQITERFTRAVDQLGSDKRDVRVGGIYALERIARDSPEDHPQVMEVLTAYLGEHARWPEPRLPAKARLARAGGRRSVGADPPPDIQAAIKVIGRRDFERDRTGDRISLSDVDLRNATMRDGHFEDARLRRSNLAGAHLEGAHFERARLGGAHLDEADLAPDPDLGLPAASLAGASLPRATLIGTRLECVELTGADLRGARLDLADLRGATLTAANLDGASVQGAVYDDRTQWPEGFDPEPAGGKRRSGGV